MPEPNGRELLSEWRQVMESVVASAASAAGRSELPGDLLRASQRQLEMVQELMDAERRLRGDVVGGLLAPFDALFDLLAETASTLRRQAEALEAAGRALEESAALVRGQAELFERMIAAVRQPSELVRSATRARPRKAKAAGKPRGGAAKD